MSRVRPLSAATAVLLAVAVLTAGGAHGATVEVALRDNFADPAKAKAQQGDSVNWTNRGGNMHTVSSDIGLFESPGAPPNVGLPPGASYSFVFTAAGKYSYHCEIHGFSGVIVVPVKASPASGTTSTTFTVTWASSVPSGWVEDVQIKRPGATVFKDWRMGQSTTSSTFTPDRGRGTYYFQARLRNLSNGVVSTYTGPRAITVS